jgi:inosine/xanthosine triphosphatase
MQENYVAMSHIIISSKNPVKVNAATIGFENMFPSEVLEVEGLSVPSGVSDQPMSSAETLQGAINRVQNAVIARGGADYYVGIEGGCEEKNGEMEAFAWVVVRARDGRIGKGRTGSFYLPPKVAELVRAGMELGAADDVVFGRTNSKQENGAVGLLTGNVIDRTAYYVDAVVFALIPFKNSALYGTLEKTEVVQEHVILG